MLAERRAMVLISSRYRELIAGALVLIAALVFIVAPERNRNGFGESGGPFVRNEITPTEFSRIIKEFSEDGGYFRSENFISNETSYLHIVDKLQQLSGQGGAYIGVGPEQNFTYIAKTRPQIAFIVDIRRQAIIQHLMFKAIFHLSKNSSQFLYFLLSRPTVGKDVPGPSTSIDDALAYVRRTSADDRVFEANLAKLKKVIQDEFQVTLGVQDLSSLGHVYENFKVDGLDISFRLDGAGAGGLFGFFPTLGELIVGRDLNGKRGNFLINSEDYEFVRQMHERNLIIPIVGDFAGKKAFPAIANYLRKGNYQVSVFYTSNVEQYLFDGGSFNGFVENVRKLPINERSLFIRTVFDFIGPHPAKVLGHNVTTLLQYMPIFLKDYDEGRYTDYWNLVTTHYISAERPG